ncbi:MAG: hypothetical protein M1825_005271 [Sarcosagium campestre]|nr:MAG: hypothetical protein M1825_005271 [Sarcosagium campestre]
MAQHPTMNLKGDESGYFDHVATILAARHHPIIIVEEAALRWMGLRVSSKANLDLLIRDQQMDDILHDLLATGRYELVDQDLRYRLSDRFVKQVPRLQHFGDHIFNELCLSLWSETNHMLTVDGPVVEVPDLFALNTTLIQDRFDPTDFNAALGYNAMVAQGYHIIPPVLAQSPDLKKPVFVPTIPRMIDSYLDQLRYRAGVKDKDPNLGRSRALPGYNIRNFIRYLHLDQVSQQAKLIPELAERNRADMVLRANNFKRKPLVKSAKSLLDQGL